MKDFLQIKKLIALLLTMVFSYLAISGKVSSEQFLTVFSLVIAFYFGQSTVRQTISENLDGKIAQSQEATQVINPVNIANDKK